MDLDAASWRIGSRGATLGLIALLALAVNAGAAGPAETTKLDCGVNALFILLRLEGRPVTLDRLESALPPRHPDGYSMAELATAARSLGLSLEGARFIKGDKAPTRPAIAFLQDARGGHFAVLRPVGTTGTMVQAIDPPRAPWIADYNRLLAARVWTGRILVPSDPWFVRHAAILMASTCGLLLLAAALRHRVRTVMAHGPNERRPPDLVVPISPS